MLNATAAATLPQLSPRHNAMLAEMGVPVWWHLPTTEAPATAPAPAIRGVAPYLHDRAMGQSQTVPAPAPATGVRPPAPAVPMARAPAPVAIPLVPVSDVSGLDWPALQQAIAQCQACALGTQRRQAVPGMGDTQPDWLIVGEAPGEEEDRQGLPFVGRSGQLLDKMLRAMGLSRTQGVYIANVIKCRPPLNRNPEPQEVAQCSPYLLRQIALLRPKIVLTMGRFAAQAVLGQGGCYAAEALHRLPLGQLRGRIYQAQLGALNLPVVATYHPAYLLRSPAEKAKAWADLCLAMEVYAQQGR
ncbi:MAG: uracil-DNA glycosylase [Macromonas sp.]